MKTSDVLSWPRLSLKMVLLVISAFILGACSDDGSDGDGGTGLSSAYLVQVETQTPDGTRFVYLNVLESLTDEIDLSQALELGGASRLRTAFGKVYAFNSEDLVVTRFGVNQDRSIVEEDRFTMSNTGIQAYSGNVVFISESLAVLVDGPTRQFIWWNPTSLEVVGTTAFPESGLGDAPGAGQASLSSDGQHLIVPLTDLDFATLEASHGARAIVVSVESQEVVGVPFDSRCPYSQRGVVDPISGDYIYVGDAFSGFATHYSVPNAGTGCLLRIRAGETSFDQTWRIDATTMTPEGFGDLASLIVSGDQFFAIFRDENRAPIADVENPGFYFGGPGTFFRPYIGSTSDWQGSRVSGFEDTNLFGFPVVVDGQFLLSPADITDRGPDVVSDLFGVVEGSFERLTQTSGFIRTIVRIR